MKPQDRVCCHENVRGGPAKGFLAVCWLGLETGATLHNKVRGHLFET